AVDVADRQLDRDARLDVEEDRHLGAEAEVLAALAHVEGEGRLTLAGLAAVDEGKAVLDLQPTHLGRQRRAGAHLDLVEAVLVALYVEGPDHACGVLPVLAVRVHAPGGPSGVNGPGLGTADVQRSLDSTVVDHFHQDRYVAELLKGRRAGAAGDLDARLGI